MAVKASTKPVTQKLGLKPTQRVAFLNIPTDANKLLAVPKGMLVSKKLSAELDFILSFYESTREMKADLKKIQKSLAKTGMA